MLSRLVAAFVGLAVAVIVLFGVPRGFVVAELVESERRTVLSGTAELAEHVVADALADGAAVDRELLAGVLREDERIEYRADGQPPVVVPSDAELDPDDLVVEREVGENGALSVSYPRSVVRAAVLDELRPLILLAAALVVMAGVAGWLLARRLAPPFGELARTAEHLGRGHLDVAVPRYAMPEADAIARSLEDGAHRLQRMVRREREVSDYASHDLRTPITALRLSLEDLSLWPETPPAVADELTRILAEVDRFSAAVTNLVDVPAPSGGVDLLDLTSVVRQAIRGRTTSGDRGRSDVHFRLGSEAPVLGRLPTGPAREVVDLLLEHAAEGATDEVVVSVFESTGYLTIELRCSAYDASASGTGMVWDQAIGLAGDLGGRLADLSPAEGGRTWTLTLPKGLTMSRDPAGTITAL